MGKRKLKGNNVKKIPEHKKKKMEKTLEAMGKNRDEDNRILRDIITEKLKWAISETEKGVNAVNAHQEAIEKLKKQILKLEGIVLAYEEVLKPPVVEKDNKENKC